MGPTEPPPASPFDENHLTLRHWMLLLVGPSLLGGLIGALLLTLLPEHYFARIVPWLLLLAALLYWLQPRLRKWLGRLRGLVAGVAPLAELVVAVEESVRMLAGG